MKRMLLLLLILFFCFGLSASEIRFAFWGNETRIEAMEKAASLYEDRNKDVSIILEDYSYSEWQQNLMVAMRENTLPDITAFDYKWTGWIDSSKLTDLRKLETLDFSNMETSFIENYSGSNEKLIGIPLGLNGLGLVYSVPFLSRFSLSDPSGWDWEDIIENGERVHREDPDCYLFFVPDAQWHYIIRTHILQHSGHHILSSDGSVGCTREDLEDSFAFVLRLVETGTIPPFGLGVLYENWLPQTNEMWRTGKWGMTTASSSTVPDMIIYSPFAVGTAPYPVAESAIDKGVYAAPTMLLGISEASEHKEEAAAFINFLENDREAAAIISDSCGMPLNKQIAAEDEESLIYPVVISAFQNASDESNPYEMEAELQELISEYVHLVGFGMLTPEEAAAEMIIRVEDISDSLM